MGFIQTTKTAKEKSNQVVAILKENAPLLLQNMINFANDHFHSDEVDKRRDAHKLSLKLIDKAIPNTTVVTHDDTGHISEELATILVNYAKKNKDNVKEIEHEIIEENNETK